MIDARTPRVYESIAAEPQIITTVLGPRGQNVVANGKRGRVVGASLGQTSPPTPCAADLMLGFGRAEHDGERVPRRFDVAVRGSIAAKHHSELITPLQSEQKGLVSEVRTP
jgi:hypothetical protein